ncbi:MAG: ribosomal-processing cysteine protease Prp [Clostridia bacterium]|nr:ribosomal-processing cysteine protease Prp [Clostridia bacterium]MBQ4137638.1 ribosomal-processing cysteine protease Prp [Clostridia bacterium]
MTEITFYTSDGVFYGFTEKGHTLYGEEGNDILCAALSSMTMLIINTIEVGFGSSVDYIIDDDTTTVKLIARSALPVFEEDECIRFAVSGLIASYYHQLEELVEEYYDYLDVKVTELDP